jgi:multisubunit Na+/H+ antiporter MnhB subunit
MEIGFFIDAILALGLVILAQQVVSQASILRSIILFVVFGLVMALAWTRLLAPDLALAEAAIGAGVTGALMMMAWRRLLVINPDKPADTPGRRSRTAIPIAVLAAALVAAIGLSALDLEPHADDAGRAAAAAMTDTGLGNPVTGVLLLFRNLDTLLEMAVLLIALLGARAIGAPARPKEAAVVEASTPLVGALLTILVPLSILIATHLLLAGTSEPGGAFQAGAVLAAGGVALVLTARLQPHEKAGWMTRMAISVGLLAFIGIGAGVLAFGQTLLVLPGTWAVYLIETAMMVSIGLTLALLFAGAPALVGRQP